MQMTVVEMIQNYRQADDHRKQIKILSELNGCSKLEIETILAESGYMKLFVGNKDLSIDIPKMVDMRNQGKSQTEIAKLYGTTQPKISLLLNESAAEKKIETEKLEKIAKEVVEPKEKEKAKVNVNGVMLSLPKIKTGGIIDPTKFPNGIFSCQPDVPELIGTIGNPPKPDRMSSLVYSSIAKTIKGSGIVQSLKSNSETLATCNDILVNYANTPPMTAEELQKYNDSTILTSRGIDETPNAEYIWSSDGVTIKNGKEETFISKDVVFTTKDSDLAREFFKREQILKDTDQVNHPNHYGGVNNPYEAIKVIDAWNLDFCLGNTVKYISRAGKKDDNSEIQDLEKAQFYLNHRIKQLKELSK